MGTYIIHFDDKPWQDLDDEQYYRCKEIPWFSTTKITISRLTPYTEDAAYAHGYTEAESKYREIRDELEKQAYEKGYETAKHECNIQAEKALREVGNRHYQKGLNDAWECARTIFCTSRGELERIFDLEEDDNGLLWVYHEYTASEAIEKIRQYEQEKEEQITKGDVVLIKSTPEVEILVTYADEEYVSGIALTEVDGNCEIGDQYTNIRISNVEKTGKHYDIVSVLQKIKESDNG